MALHRLTSITLGVPDPDGSQEFLTRFGLEASGHGWFSTRDGDQQLELTQSPTRALRRLGVGGEHEDDLNRIEAAGEAAAPGTTDRRSAEQLILTEPVTGLTIDVTVADPYPTTPTARSVNAPGTVARFDHPAASVLNTERARPSNLTHVVYSSPDQPTTLAFFTNVLGFEISDAMPGIIAFTRCGDVHHNFAIQAGPVAYPHHIAFEMDSIDDVVRSGQHMVDQDPEHHTWGLGRHAIGSNWFWYLRDPSGLFVEYAADIDRISDQDLYRPKDWQGREFLYSYGPPVPAEFLEPTDLAELIAASAG